MIRRPTRGRPAASMPTPRCHLSVVALNGLIYAIGGTNTSGSIKYTLVEVYNPTTDTWTTAASMPTGRQDIGAAVLNGHLYAVGGWNPALTASGELAVVEVYDPGTNTWTTKAPMPTARSLFGAAVNGGLFYAIGGVDADDTVLGTVEKYDPATNTWSTGPPLPTPRVGFAAHTANGVIYAIGGRTSNGSVSAVNEALTPCCTQGPPGPQGPAGATGPQGPQGETGSARGARASRSCGSNWTNWTTRAAGSSRYVRATACHGNSVDDLKEHVGFCDGWLSCGENRDRRGFHNLCPCGQFGFTGFYAG